MHRYTRPTLPINLPQLLNYSTALYIAQIDSHLDPPESLPKYSNTDSSIRISIYRIKTFAKRWIVMDLFLVFIFLLLLLFMR